MPGDVDEVRAWAEAVTGLEIDEQGVVRDLGPDDLARRRERFGRIDAGLAPPGPPSEAPK